MHAPRRRRIASALALAPLSDVAAAAAAAAAALAGCAAPDAAAPLAAPAGERALLTPWRVVPGGFLSPSAFAPPGTPPRMGGMYTKFIAPAAVALAGNDLLVADAGSGRLWRADAALNQMTGIAGAPVAPTIALALGPDLSAWVLDAAARQVLRFARDGRLLQTWRVPIATPAPAGLALADGGGTLLVADALGAQWAELRNPGAGGLAILPRDAAGERILGCDALAALGDAVFLLDRKAGVVHRAGRDGRVQASLGRGALDNPVAMAVDRGGRIFVIDAAGRALVVLREGEAPRRFDAASLRLARLSALAVDERTLAVGDSLLGQVALFLIAAEGGR